MSAEDGLVALDDAFTARLRCRTVCGRRVVYLPAADKSSMQTCVCTPQHEMGHLLTLFPVVRS
jgi:hypothetical protein